MSVQEATENDQVDIRVLPGLPQQVTRVPDGRGAYPGTTTDLVKILRERGLRVVFAEAPEQRATLTLKAAELWFPILQFGAAVASGAAGGLLADAIEDLLGSDRVKATLHVKCSIRYPDGAEREFEAAGPASEVLEALREFKSDGSDDPE